MSNRAFLKELKVVDPKALMKKAAQCEEGTATKCAQPAKWFFQGKYFCLLHAQTAHATASVAALTPLNASP